MKRATIHAIRPEDRRLAPAGAAGIVLGGKYRLEKAIAEGGMGRVWRASHLTLNSPVAVKFVEAMGSTAEERTERFLKEAQVAASVRHRHIVDILDFGASPQGEPYMVMELLEGEALDQRMAEGPVPLEESLEITFQLLSGLEAVHRAGIIHHDLKPANVFLTNDEVDGLFVRLLDFGISEGTGDAHTGQERPVVGTPEYMSPEQAFGEQVDTTSDIYSVGVILYELLAGFAPFEDDDPQVVLEAVAHQTPPPLSNVRPDIPAICAVVAQAMARLRSDRFLSAVDMRKALLMASGGRRLSGVFAPAARADDSGVIDMRTSTLAFSHAASRSTPVPAPPSVPPGALDRAMTASEPPTKASDRMSLLAALITLVLVLGGTLAFVAWRQAGVVGPSDASSDSEPSAATRTGSASESPVAVPPSTAPPPRAPSSRAFVEPQHEGRPDTMELRGRDEVADHETDSRPTPRRGARATSTERTSTERTSTERTSTAPTSTERTSTDPQPAAAAEGSADDEAEVGGSRIIHDLDF